jgi:DNA-directed RNA polymerase specialized sigma24 family protein
MLQVADAMDPADPAELIAAAADGDLSAFEHLYRQFSPRVYGLCLRLTGQREAAEDCTQESFVAAWRALRRGLRVQYEVAEPDSGLPEVADPSGDGPPLDIERAIAALPEGARHVLVLVSIYGFSHAEAAQTLGIAEGTCKAQLHRARGLLAAALGVERS